MRLPASGLSGARAGGGAVRLPQGAAGGELGTCAGTRPWLTAGGQLAGEAAGWCGADSCVCLGDGR